MTADILTPTPSRAAVNALLDTFLRQQVATASTISPQYEELWKDIERLLHSGGKRLRPLIMLLSYQMFGGTQISSVMPAAASLELLHLGMLIHDDVIDRDDIRYGVPNITGSYKTKYTPHIKTDQDRTHFAQSAALLAGDLLLSSSYLLMAESDVESKKILEIQQLLGRSVFEVIGGELIDTESVFRPSKGASSETVALYKTASYSFIMPLLVGAALAGVSKERMNTVKQLGATLGIGFQLRDDVLGVFGDESITGKSASGDIREGKQTYMVEQFYAISTDSQRDAFDSLFGNPDISETEVASVRTLLVESGALQKTEDMINAYEQQSREALADLDIEPTYVSQFEDLINAITKRIM